MAQHWRDIIKDLRARVGELEEAIKSHRSQKADDRCIFDDDELYKVLGDNIKCDRQVGSKEAMLENCKKFIEKRCESGRWATYTKLEETLKDVIQDMKDRLEDVDPDPSPRNGTRQSLQNRIDYLERVLKGE